MSDTEQWQLIPEAECDDQDDYPDDDQTRRDIAGWERQWQVWSEQVTQAWNSDRSAAEIIAEMRR